MFKCITLLHPIEMEVYHETFKRDKQKILEEGLKRQSIELLTQEEIQTENGSYILPQNTHDPRGYAQRLTYTILEQERPKDFPKHHHCIFFFPTKELIGEMDRPIYAKIDTQALEENTPIYETPFNISIEYFHNTMNTFDWENQYPIEKLHEKANKYWNKTYIHDTTQEIINNKSEIYIKTDKIPPKHIKFP